MKRGTGEAAESGALRLDEARECRSFKNHSNAHRAAVPSHHSFLSMPSTTKEPWGLRWRSSVWFVTTGTFLPLSPELN